MRTLAVRRRLTRAGARRAYWAVISQALDSGSNFFLSVWVARAVTPKDFGAFGIVYVALAMAILISRSAANMPMMIMYATSPKRFERKTAGDVLGVSGVFGLALSALAVAVGFLASGPLVSVAFASAVIAPGLLLQDCCVYIFFSRQLPRRAVANHAIWFVFQVPAFVIASDIFGSRRSWIFMVLWGIGAYVATAVSLIQLRSFPVLSRARSWLRRFRSAIVDLTVEATLAQAAQQAVVYVFAVGVDLVGVAAFRAAQVPLGLLRVFLNGLVPIGISEGARLYAKRARLLVVFIFAWALAGVGANLAAGVVLYAMPVSAGEVLLGKSWIVARPVLLGITVAAAATAAVTAVQSGLRALAATRPSVLLRIPLVLLQLGGALAGVLWAGLKGGVMGYAVGSGVGAVLALVVFQRTFHQAQGTGVGRHRPLKRAGDGKSDVSTGVRN